MTPTLEILRDRDIEVRRDKLIRKAGMPVDEMRARAKKYELDQRRQAILRQIEELDFLSGQ